MTTCTVVVGAQGRRCGKPAVGTFAGLTGERWAECAEHHRPVSPLQAHPATVAVHRHGKTYQGRVTRVTRGGTVYAEVTYDNGVTREVRV